jgi:hypothetical protein
MVDIRRGLIDDSLRPLDHGSTLTPMRNFGFSLVGNIHQVIINTENSDKFGLPRASEPILNSFTLDQAFEGTEIDIFRALRWDYGLVETLYGRDEHLSAIINWAEGGSIAATARLVTGEGGSGKTRLAAAAANALRKRGWTAGFLPQTEAIQFQVGERGLLLIFDYPEEQIERTRALLRKLAELRNAPYPLRVLFLSRRSFAEWEEETDILEGRFGRQAIAVPSMLPSDRCLALIGEAAHNLAKHMSRPIPDLKGAEKWLNTSALHRLPLFATAAAIHAVLAPTEAFGIDGSELIHDLVRRERRRVRETSLSLGLGESGLATLLAFAVLADGLSGSTIQVLALRGVCGDPNLDVLGAVVRSPWWKAGA